MRTLERNLKEVKSKKISVSQKRQITIPKEYFEALNIGDEIECYMEENCIVIKPVVEDSINEFSEYILQDIIKEGFNGDEILKEFKKRRKKLENAAKEFNKKIDEEAKNIDNLASFEDVFGKEDDN